MSLCWKLLDIKPPTSRQQNQMMLHCDVALDQSLKLAVCTTYHIAPQLSYGENKASTPCVFATGMDAFTGVFSESYISNLYRPQRKVMFSQACVKNSVGVQTRQTPSLGRLGRQPPGQTPPPPRHSYCSGRYASYWNAFLW